MVLATVVAKRVVRVGGQWTGRLKVEIFTQNFDVVGLFEEVLVGKVLLEQIEQQVEAVFDHYATVDSSLTFDDLENAVEAALEGDNLLDVGVRTGQIVQEKNGLRMCISNR